MKKAAAAVVNLFTYNGYCVTYNLKACPFEMMLMPVSYRVDLEKLEQNLSTMHEVFHPDLYPSDSMEREIAECKLGALNSAYEVLMDPMLRAEALMNLKHIEIPGIQGRTTADPELMTEALEIKEALEEASNCLINLQELITSLTLRQSILEFQLDQAFVDNNQDLIHSVYIRLSFVVKTRKDAESLLAQKSRV
jgi:molecular chaperone HscB